LLINFETHKIDIHPKIRIPYRLIPIDRRSQEYGEEICRYILELFREYGYATAHVQVKDKHGNVVRDRISGEVKTKLVHRVKIRMNSTFDISAFVTYYFNGKKEM
jgi:citrate lyase gamma subunit